MRRAGVLLLAAAACACASLPYGIRDKTAEPGFQLMEQGNWDNAISDFTNRINASPDRAIVRTRLRRMEVDVAVVAAGPWLNELLRPLGLEQPVESAMGQASVFRGSGWDEQPCLMEWDRDGVEAGYGMPIDGSGYKLGLNATTRWNLEDEERRPDHAESLVLSRRVAERFVALGSRPTRTERCPVTTTPDGAFIVDRRGATVVAGGCSGHGFMFSPALGEMIADLVEGSRSPEPFRIGRPGLYPARLIS